MEMSSFLSSCVQTSVLQGRTRACLGCGWGPRVWSTVGPRSPPGFFFLWLKADKDICDPSGYQDSHGNSLVSYSALVPTKNGGGREECSRSKEASFIVFWCFGWNYTGKTAFFWDCPAFPLNPEGPVLIGGGLSPNLRARCPGLMQSPSSFLKATRYKMLH